jgi:alkylation response protein AidB-like acyl-CoA dehydrogenase
MAWGTPEQCAYFLPRILDGTDRYCQGFSEPDAGSDLAALKTVGRVVDDEIVITGQKLWTSGAHTANMMFCLCRTDPDAPRHRGISFVLVPMATADGASNGIEIRPIRQMTGDSDFAATFLDEARAPLRNVIGGLNNGWRVTMTTMAASAAATPVPPISPSPPSFGAPSRSPARQDGSTIHASARTWRGPGPTWRSCGSRV